MSRYGAMYGPDLTFLGVDACDLSEPSTYDGADVVIVGAGGSGMQASLRLAQAGLNTFRFSIEWARVEPVEGLFSIAALEHYRDVLEACRRRGVRTMVSFNHFVNPIFIAVALGLVLMHLPIGSWALAAFLTAGFWLALGVAYSEATRIQTSPARTGLVVGSIFTALQRRASDIHIEPGEQVRTGAQPAARSAGSRAVLRAGRGGVGGHGAHSTPRPRAPPVPEGA